MQPFPRKLRLIRKRQGLIGELTHTAMKRLLLPALASVSLLLGACSTNRLAQVSTNDDVYYSQAKAKEVEYPQKNEQSYRTNEQLYGGGDYADDNVDYDYDYGYASRLNRFYYASPWRTYYDSWYSYSYDPWYSYRYDPWFYGSGLSLSFGFGYPYYTNYYSPWGYYGYGNPYYGNYWGPVSYYGGYPYGYGYGGGYYGGGIASGRNNRSRPNMGTGNPNYGKDRSGARPADRSYGSGRGSVSRPEGYSTRPTTDGRTSSGTTQRPRPSVDRTNTNSRPARAETPTREAYPSSTPSTSSSSRGSSSGSTSSGSGGSSSTPSRGSRGGR